MTKIINKGLYKLYKPLRNHLRRVSIENAFYVIWAYINNFQFKEPFPKDIEVHEQILKAENVPTRGVYEWELSLLAREIIVNGESYTPFAVKNFNKSGYFSNAINKLKSFENNAWPIYGNGVNIHNEMRRIAHRQFPWQFKTTMDDFIRYYKIYNNKRVSKFVKERIGITTQQWYTIGIAFFGATLKYSKMNIDSKIQINNITKKEFDVFTNFTSNDIEGLKEVIERTVNFNDEYVYSLNPLEYYPLIKIGIYFYCPIINFLVWRITSGLYFDLIDNKNYKEDFGHPFGLAVQDYVEEISKIIIKNSITKVIPEQKYKVNGLEKDSVDIILSQKDSAFFVEVKSKRLLAKSKSQLVFNDAINKDLDILSDDIVKVYSTIQDYMNNHYKHFLYKENYKIFPIIVTLEDWFLIGNDLKNLKEKVLQKLKDKNVPTSFLQDMPYSLCSIRFYEQLIQSINRNKIEAIMGKWNSPEREGHDFGNFITVNYGTGNKNLSNFFPKDFEKIYSEFEN